MPITPKLSFSPRVAARVIEERGLEGKVTPEQLAEAASTHDRHNGGYLSRDELKLGAANLATKLGVGAGDDQRGGLAYPRELLDDVKTRLSGIGLLVTHAEVRRALCRIDDGDRRANPGEIASAARALVEAARLEQLGRVSVPARPGIQAEAQGATPDLARRKLADTFRYPGSGPVKVAFLDADSTLRVSASGSVSANGPTDVRLLPFVADRLKELAEAGYLVAIVSNQAGVKHGHVTIEDADAALQHTVDLVRAAGGDVHYVDYAEDSGPDRKPGTGMAERLQSMLTTTFGADARIDKDASMMVGDSAYKRGHDTRPEGSPGTHFSNSDRRFAEAFGLPFREPAEEFGWAGYGIPQFDDHKHLDGFLDRFRLGHRATDGPLFARFRQD